VVENNQFLELGQTTNKEGMHASALRFVLAEELHVAGNAVRRFSSAGRQAASRAAILAVGPGSAHIDSNRLAGIAPPEGFLGHSSGIELVSPFRSASIAANAVLRRGDEQDKLAGGTWTGVIVRAAGVDIGGAKTAFAVLGDLAVAYLDQQVVLFTATTARAVALRARADVALRANEIVAEASDAPPVLVSEAALCELAENRIRSPRGRGRASQVRCSRAIVSGNDFRGLGDLEVLEVDLVGKGQAAVLGNLRTGGILVNGNALADPWAPLNPISPE
jgi:hypothetical protein